MSLLGRLAIAAMTLAAAAAPAASSAASPADIAVRDWLRARLERAEVDHTLAWADLNGDDRAEALAYVTDREMCGMGGCMLYILEPRRSGLQLRGRLTITRPPISVLQTRTHGWRDVGVGVCGGGITTCYRARVQFDGWKYRSNPSLARALKRGAPERIVIATLPNQ